MRLFCRDEHDKPDDRCPPHQFNGALWDDVGTSTTLSVIFCSLCGDIRPLEAPTFAVPELESISADTEE